MERKEEGKSLTAKRANLMSGSLLHLERQYKYGTFWIYLSLFAAGRTTGVYFHEILYSIPESLLF
jgi:hypothetical protein